MPRWRRSLLGALLGLVLGAVSMAAWILMPYSQNTGNAGMGQQDSAAIVTGMILMVFVSVGAVLGCIIGITLGLLWPWIKRVYKSVRLSVVPILGISCVAIFLVSLLSIGFHRSKAPKGQAKSVLTIPVTFEIVSLDFAPNNQWIATIDMQNSIRIRNMYTGKVISQLHKSNAVFETKFFPDSKTIAGISDHGIVSLWSTSTGRPIATLKGHQVLVPERELIYDAATGQTSRPVTNRRTQALVSTIDISPNGKLLATGSDDKTVEVWNVQTHHRLQVFRAHQSPISKIAFSPNGRTLASIDEDGIVIVWNPYSGRIAGTFKAEKGNSIQWTSDDKELISYNAMKKKSVWDVRTFKLKKTIDADAHIKHIYPLNPTQKASFSANNTRLAVCEDDSDLSDQSGGIATIYNVKNGETLYGFATAKPDDADLSPDGKLLVIAGVEYKQQFKNGYRKVIQFWSVP